LVDEVSIITGALGHQQQRSLSCRTGCCAGNELQIGVDNEPASADCDELLKGKEMINKIQKVSKKISKVVCGAVLDAMLDVVDTSALSFTSSSSTAEAAQFGSSSPSSGGRTEQYLVPALTQASSDVSSPSRRQTMRICAAHIDQQLNENDLKSLARRESPSCLYIRESQTRVLFQGMGAAPAIVNDHLHMSLLPGSIPANMVMM
jgi:hypothetical protein